MAYFYLLNLKKEPFSNSPDPELFFHSYQHQSCLQKLELALRLRRGLSVVIGNIGTGKSTLSRQLVRLISKDNQKIIAHLILDPEFTSPKEFLLTIIKTFGIAGTPADSEWQMKEAIKTYLFVQGVDKQMIPALIIDEGQKLPTFCVEILREFLNYETNQHKLLQIIIFAQNEFQAVLKEKANFADRITTLQYLTPLNFKETRQMIQFRINKTLEDPQQKLCLFSPLALFAIYLISGGYPRKIIMLCSKIVFTLLIKEKKRAGLSIVLTSARETSIPLLRKSQKIGAALIIFLAVLAILLAKANLHEPNQVGSDSAIAKTTIVSKTVSNDTKVDIRPNLEGKEEKVNQAVVPTADYPEEKQELTTSNALKTFATFSTPTTPILGKLTINNGDSLSKMIARVYGQYNKDRLKELLANNPHIKDPSAIPAATEIILPVLKKAAHLENGKIIILLAKEKTLTDAYLLVRDYPDSAPPLLIKPVWQNEPQISFAVMVEELFNDEDGAKETIRLLPAKYRQQAVLLETKDP